ncbi:MAG: NUDIX hydrolase [Candidatus Levybacteria bacterium]|nr:NUDIX hydrolase [Candidatus Levybacteria bacterium]
MQKTVRVGVAPIIKRDSKVLLGKRMSIIGDSTWAFPGGKLEMNETFEECAKREAMEESGVRIKNIEFAGVTNDIFLKEQEHYITIFVVSDWKSGEAKVMEPEKCSEWDWFEWNKLPKPLFLPVENLLKQNYNPFK